MKKMSKIKLGYKTTKRIFFAKLNVMKNILVVCDLYLTKTRSQSYKKICIKKS